MAAINKRIPNFLGGVSQQPDSIKFPGQLRVCDNAVPDVTFGLTKRPPGEFVGKMANANDSGYWYEIIREGSKKFLVQITPANTGSIPIRIWDLATGQEKSLTNSSGDGIFSYLSGATQPYGTQSIQDYTIITNPQKTVGTTGTVGGLLESGNYAYARLDTIAYNTEYVLYTGNDPPGANTYYRVTAVKVTKDGADDDQTWDSTDTPLGKYAGQKEWKSATAGADGYRASGSLLINANNHIYDHDAHYQGDSQNQSFPNSSGIGEDFKGFTAKYKTQYTASVTLKESGRFSSDPGLGNTIADDITVEGVSYDIRAQAIQSFETYEGVSGIAYYRTPKNPDEGTVSMATVLKKLKDDVNSDLSNVSAIVVGNGLFLYGSDAAKVNFLGGTVNEGMTVIAQTATDVSKLPSACRKDYVVRIDNSENEDSDNYYLKFKTDSGENIGSGFWEECARPNGLNFAGDTTTQTLGLDPATMPHALVYNYNSDNFTFKKLDSSSSPDQYWKDRDVGDLTTNPMPTFNGSKIQNIFFYRNRLGLIADEQVVMSRPGDYFNFFNVSAITTSDDNPIDITVSDTRPAYIRHVLPIQKGVMMMSDNGQFLLFTESDIFSAKTVRLKKVSSYECDSDINPVDMGTTVMWASTVGAYSRTYEAKILDDSVPPQVVEQTRVVPEFVPNTVTLSAVSSALGLVTYGKKGDSNIYHYKYFDSGDRRDQSAWFSWTLTGTLQHALYTAGNFYTVTKQGSDYILSRHEYVTDTDTNSSYTLGTGTVGSTLTTSRWFEACLDNMQSFTSGWSYADPLSSITLGYSPTDWTKIYLVVLSGDEAGAVIQADSSSSGTTAKFNINLTSGSPKVAVGYRYDTLIELPTYYFEAEPGRYDTDGDLRISGINFEMGVSGPMEFELSSKYGDVDTYTQYESGMLIGTGQFSEPPAVLNKAVRVPIQRKNDKYTLQIKIPDPFSTALISGSWDGRYNTRRHVRK